MGKKLPRMKLGGAGDKVKGVGNLHRFSKVALAAGLVVGGYDAYHFKTAKDYNATAAATLPMSVPDYLTAISDAGNPEKVNFRYVSKTAIVDTTDPKFMWDNGVRREVVVPGDIEPAHKPPIQKPKEQAIGAAGVGLAVYLLESKRKNGGNHLPTATGEPEPQHKRGRGEPPEPVVIERFPAREAWAARRAEQDPTLITQRAAHEQVHAAVANVARQWYSEPQQAAVQSKNAAEMLRKALAQQADAEKTYSDRTAVLHELGMEDVLQELSAGSGGAEDMGGGDMDD